VASRTRRRAGPAGKPRPCPAIHRGGFDGLWEASNVLELTSHAYEGDLYGADNQPIHFSGRHRADFMTDRAQNFLRSPVARSPFFLTLSYLEVHHQTDTYDPSKEFKNRYPNPFVPGDLRPLPGTWPSQLSDYCVLRDVGILHACGHRSTPTLPWSPNSPAGGTQRRRTATWST